MSCRPAPTHDLDHLQLRLRPAEMETLFYRWADRALRELVPRALSELGHGAEAQVWRATLETPLDPSTAGRAYALFRETRQRIWPAPDAPELQKLAFHVLGCAEPPIAMLARLGGHIHEARTSWSEQTGPGEVVHFTAEELEELAKLRPTDCALAARTIVHTLGGQAAFAGEVARQYGDLAEVGCGGPYEGLEWGTPYRGSHLVSGRRYRVYEPFVDGDGGNHPWGESWQFDKFAFDAKRCEVELHVSGAELLDGQLKPVARMSLGTFRLPWSMGDRRGYPQEPVERLITGMF